MRISAYAAKYGEPTTFISGEWNSVQEMIDEVLRSGRNVVFYNVEDVKLTVTTHLGEITASPNTLNAISSLLWGEKNRSAEEFPYYSETCADSAREIYNALEAAGYYARFKEEKTA